HVATCLTQVGAPAPKALLATSFRPRLTLTKTLLSRKLAASKGTDAFRFGPRRRGINRMSNILRHLQVGQIVGVLESETGYKLTVHSADQAGQAVVEVGVDYVVLEDPAAGVKTRIPSHYLLGLTDPAALPAAPVETAPQAA